MGSNHRKFLSYFSRPRQHAPFQLPLQVHRRRDQQRQRQGAGEFLIGTACSTNEMVNIDPSLAT